MSNNEKVDISFYGTVYNSAKYIRRTLTRLAEIALELKKYGITSEIVIVDNYSTDGTWGLINEIKELYAKKGVDIRLLRYKCSRGLGRNIALRFAQGKILFFIDLDTEYDIYNTIKLIVNYIKNLGIEKCLYIFLVPRSVIIRAGGIYDLNRAEDIELCARLTKHCIVLPVIDESLTPISFGTFMKQLNTEIMIPFFLTTYFSEIRYAKNLLDYIKREFRNKVDMISGMGYTWRKIIYEASRLRKLTDLKILIWIIYHLIFHILTILFQKQINEYSKIINNGSLCDVAMFLNYIAFVVNLIRNQEINDVQKFINHIKDFLHNEYKAKAIQYYLTLNPEALRKALKGYYFMED